MPQENKTKQKNDNWDPRGFFPIYIIRVFAIQLKSTTKPFYLQDDTSMYNCSEMARLSAEGIRTREKRTENILTIPYFYLNRKIVYWDAHYNPCMPKSIPSGKKTPSLGRNAICFMKRTLGPLNNSDFANVQGLVFHPTNIF